MNTEEELRTALQRRADLVEPTPDSYARLAQRVHDARQRRTGWWRSPELLWVGATAAVAAAVIAVVVVSTGGPSGEDVTTDPDPAPVVSPTPEPSTPTPEPTGTGQPLGPPAGVIWPLAEADPFEQWATTPEEAATRFVTFATGQDLPVAGVDDVDPVAMVADVSVQSLGEDGQPFGEAAVVRVAGGLDDAGIGRWGVLEVRSERIEIDGWNFIGEPQSFEPQGRGLAFEGTINVKLLDATGAVVAEGFVMGGGTELADLSGSVAVGGTAPGPGYAVFSDLGGLGIAPTALTVIRIDIPELPDLAEPTCSATDLAPDTGPGGSAEQPELPPAVAATRTQIIALAVACDYEGLAALGGPNLSVSFGGSGAVELWTDQEANGGEPMRYLVELLTRPFAVDTSLDPAYYTWPSVFTRPWSEVSQQDRDTLRPLYDEDNFADWDAFGGYIGYRISIDADGRWRTFIVGD